MKYKWLFILICTQTLLGIIKEFGLQELEEHEWYHNCNGITMMVIVMGTEAVTVMASL
jgi:hypothetical protein